MSKLLKVMGWLVLFAGAFVTVLWTPLCFGLLYDKTGGDPFIFVAVLAIVSLTVIFLVWRWAALGKGRRV